MLHFSPTGGPSPRRRARVEGTTPVPTRMRSVVSSDRPVEIKHPVRTDGQPVRRAPPAVRYEISGSTRGRPGQNGHGSNDRHLPVRSSATIALPHRELLVRSLPLSLPHRRDVRETLDRRLVRLEPADRVVGEQAVEPAGARRPPRALLGRQPLDQVRARRHRINHRELAVAVGSSPPGSRQRPGEPSRPPS